MTDWKALEEAEDHAYFMAELMDISPESFTLEEKKRILRDMIASSSATSRTRCATSSRSSTRSPRPA